MFLVTFKNTIKNLLRCVTFWLFMLLFAFIMVRYGLSDYKVYAPGFAPTTLSIDKYTGFVGNLVNAGMLTYATPVFAVITTTLVLNRDYGDQFFEIEKAGGISILRHFTGRLCALAAVVLAVQIIASFLSMYIYVGRWGGVVGMTTVEFLVDSTVRLLRIDLCVALPIILFYVGLTFLIGAVFHSGLFATFGGLGYVVANYIFAMLYQYRSYETYFGYFSPRPLKLTNYFFNLDTADGAMWNAMDGTSLNKALLCIGFLISVFSLCSIASYFLLCRREI